MVGECITVKINAIGVLYAELKKAATIPQTLNMLKME